MLVLTAAGTTLAAVTAPPRHAVPRTAVKARHARPHVNVKLVRRLRGTVWRWQAVMGMRRASSKAPLRTSRALGYWRQQVRRISRVAAHPPHKTGWLCIHRFEGSWSDSSDPYWGGLQMDRGFMEHYAPRVLLKRGWADKWTPLEQMWVAERAHRAGRGYYPWPNTARSCGLI
ncbi:MAG TPA: hypothetical protein VH297_09255 [Gaiellaceae bacterium]